MLFSMIFYEFWSKNAGVNKKEQMLFSMIFYEFWSKNAGVNKKRLWRARIV